MQELGLQLEAVVTPSVPPGVAVPASVRPILWGHRDDSDDSMEDAIAVLTEALLVCELQCSSLRCNLCAIIWSRRACAVGR